MEIPEVLKNKNFRFIILKKRDKIPIEKSWSKTNNYMYDEPKLLYHLNLGFNYGMLTGYGGLLVIDFDNPLIEDIFLPKLPKTLTVKTGSGRTHLYYICFNGRSTKVLTPDRDVLVDIQYTGRHVVGPNCKHPNGNDYFIKDNIKIANLDYSLLESTVLTLQQKKEVILDFSLPKDKKGFEEAMNLRDELFRNVRISEVLSYYGVSTSRGNTNCPLHSSKAGKCLAFNDKKGLVNCFHCGEIQGTIFNVVMVMEHCNFKTALELIKKRFG